MSSLKKQTISGVLWTFTDFFILKGAAFIASLVLARLLGPREFGLIGMINIFIVLGSTLVDSGLSASIIRTKYVGNKDFSTVFYTNLGLSILLYIIIYVLAPYIALFYHKEILIPVIRLYCCSFIISSFSIIQISILTKSLDFKKLMILNIPGTIIGIIIGIALGFMGFGVWSLVWMYLSTQIIQSLMLWVFSPWKPTLLFSKKRLVVHFKFGYKLMLSGILDTAFSNIYNVMIGKFYSVKELGFYERAYLFNQYPVTMISGIISKVTYPLLSNIQNDKEKISLFYKQILQTTFFITAPLMIGAAAVARPLFLLVLGNEWAPAVPFFQIISLSSIFYPIHAFNINILKVYGRSDLFLRLELIKKAVGIVGIIIGFLFGIYGLIWSSVATSFLALLINMYYSSQLLNYSTKKQLLDMLPTFITAACMFVFMYILMIFLSDYHLLIQIILPAVAGLVFYLGASYLINPDSLLILLKFLKKRQHDSSN